MYIHTKTSRSGARARDIKYSRVDARARSGAARGEYISRGAHEKSTRYELDFTSGLRIMRRCGTHGLCSPVNSRPTAVGGDCRDEEAIRLRSCE